MSHDTKLNAVIIPRLPKAGAEITPEYLDELVAALEEAIDVLNSTRQRNFTEINLTNTQSHGGGLRVGDVFEDSGTLKIVRTNDVFAGTLVATTALGSVTISTP